MYADESGAGLYIRFGVEEKDILENGGKLETKIGSKPHQKVIVRVQDEVPESDQLGEPGIKTKSYPPGYENRKLYKIWMDKQFAKKLMLEGFAGCRCDCSRLDMSYWK